MKHYAGSISGRYIGATNGVAPDNSIEVPVPPHACSTWVDGVWIVDEWVKREEFKARRKESVNNIKVDVNGLVFDGDEVSQGRMARCLVGLREDETITWVLSDNTSAQVSKATLLEALRLAGERQTELWVFEQEV